MKVAAPELFTRDGELHTGPFCTTEKGAAFYTRPRMCGRCGGAGRSDKWAFTGYTCFDCGGARTRGTETVKLYSAERLAKLNAAKAKADARRAAIAQAKADAHALEVAARADAFRTRFATLIERSAPHMENSFIGDVMGRAIRDCQITEPQAAAVLGAIERTEREAAQRAASGYVGKPGERLTLTVTVERATFFERGKFNAPWINEVVHIVTMRDAAGNAIVSKGRFTAEKGEQLTIKATVKEHSIYKDEKQTVIQRVVTI